MRARSARPCVFAKQGHLIAKAKGTCSLTTLSLVSSGSAVVFPAMLGP